MKVYLDRRTVVQIYCLSRQASRSVHRVLGGNWAALREYFDRERLAKIRLLIDNLSEMLPPEKPDRPRPTREAIGRGLPVSGLLGNLIGRWIAPRKKSWSFAAQEIRFIMCSLEGFIRTLDEAAEPAAERLIALRMDLATCEEIVDARCRGLPELSRATYLEHFDRTDWLPMVTLRDIIGDGPNRAPNARKSA